MSFSTLARNKNTERLIALLSAVAVLMSLMAIYAAPAMAHHPELEANQTCVDREVVLEYTSTSWLTTGASGSAHSDIRIQARPVGGIWVEVGAGAYTSANGYSFDGTFDGSDLGGQAFWNTTIEIRAFANGPWQNGAAGNQYSGTVQVNVTQDCFNPSCPGQYLEHKVEPVSSGTFGPNDEFTITVGSAAGGQVFDWTSTLPVFQVIVKGGPGANIYDYSGAFGGSGLHAPVNPSNGSFYGLSHITFCYQQSQDDPVEVSVTPGVCAVTQGQPGAAVEVTIDPDSGATVSFTNGTTTIDVSTSGSVVLSPGSWSWTATAADGFQLSGSSSGQFTIDDCAASVSIDASGLCTVDDSGAAVGSVEIVIDPTSGAVVTVYSDAAMTQEVLDTDATGTFDLAPGTYYWTADAADGFDIDGSSSGEFTIDPCEVSVEVSGECVLEGGLGSGVITVTISVDDGATVTITDGGGAVVATLNESGTVNVSEGETYSWAASAAAGFAMAGDDSGSVEIEECTPTDVGAAILVTVDGTCEVTDGLGRGEIEVTVSVADGATVVIADSSGDVVGTFTSDGTLTVPEGATYTWEATPSEGFEFPPGFESSGSIAIDRCTPDEVMASIQVTVSGSCELDGDEGEGLIDITMSVPDGATVVVRDSDGDVVGTLTDDGTLSVPEGATYTWVATPSEGFEFPPGFDSSGSFTIERCSDPETLPFTGFDPYQMGVFAILLMGAGVTAMFLAPKEEGA
jgi:hypothetical protein